MITLQVQETNQDTGKVEVLFDIETKEDSKEWMTNELHLCTKIVQRKLYILMLYKYIRHKMFKRK